MKQKQELPCSWNCGQNLGTCQTFGPKNPAFRSILGTRRRFVQKIRDGIGKLVPEAWPWSMFPHGSPKLRPESWPGIFNRPRFGPKFRERNRIFARNLLKPPKIEKVYHRRFGLKVYCPKQLELFRTESLLSESSKMVTCHKSSWIFSKIPKRTAETRTINRT